MEQNDVDQQRLETTQSDMSSTLRPFRRQRDLRTAPMSDSQLPLPKQKNKTNTLSFTQKQFQEDEILRSDLVPNTTIRPPRDLRSYNSNNEAVNLFPKTMSPLGAGAMERHLKTINLKKIVKKIASKQQLELSIKDIEQQLDAEPNEFNQIFEKMEGLLNSSQAICQLVQTTDEAANLELQEFNQDVQERVQRMVTERQQDTQDLDRRHVSSVIAANAAMMKVRNQRESSESHFDSEIGELITKLKKQLAQEQSQRNESFKQIQQRLDQECQRMNVAVKLEQQIQAEMQDKLQRHMEEMERGLMRDIQIENEERETVEAGFMDLLEQTCERIELALFSQ